MGRGLGCTCGGALLLVASAAARPQGGALDLYPPAVSRARALVDNFDPSSSLTFEQRYFSYDAWWQPGGPILLYLGNEGSIESFYNNTGAIFEHAEALGALVVFVEHRYYGESLPHGARDLGPQPPLQQLTVEQAMADYAWFIQGLRRRLRCGSRECPVVTFGGSYGGMLVVWFRQKYPQLTVGGIGAGAVIDFFPGDGRQEEFWNATMHTFEAFGTDGCAGTVEQALRALRDHASTRDGRRLLEGQLRSCDPLRDEATAWEKADLFVRGVLSSLSMLDYPEHSTFTRTLPANPVVAACATLQSQRDPLHGLKAAIDIYLNGTREFRCYDILAELVGRPTPGHLAGPVVPPDMGPWQYQACTELPLQTLSSDGFGFYPAADRQLGDVGAGCHLRYGVRPRPEWLQLSLGGSDLRVGALFLTDGEKDPWRVGSVRTARVRAGLDITHHLIPAAAHHEDLRFDSDPPRPPVQEAKRLARRAMRRWIADFRTPRVLV